jgi:hypothetical protein
LIATLLALSAGCGAQEATEAPSTEASPAQEAPAPATETATHDPCTLLTAQDIETTTGISPGAGTPAANACSWVAADGSNPRLLTLTVLHGNVTREDWLTGGGSADDIVEGVGEFAARVGSQLQVYQGGWLVGVTVRGSDRPEAAQDLARTVLGKLTG